MISSGFGPSLVEIKSLGIGLLETSNFDLDLNDSEFLAVGETYRFDGDTRNSLYNLLVNRDGVGINTSRKQLDGFFQQSVKKNTLYVGSDIVCTGNIISNGFQFDNVKFDSVNSNILENVLTKLEQKQNVLFKGYNTIRTAYLDSTQATNSSLNNYYTTNNITIGTNTDTYANASPLNIATTADNNIENTHITMTNKSSGFKQSDCGINDPEITKFRLGIVGNKTNSPAVLSTTSEMPLTFHVGLTSEQVNSLYSTTKSVPVYTGTGLTPSMTIDTRGNVIIGSEQNRQVSYTKYSKKENELISNEITSDAKLSVSGVSVFDDIVLYDYYNDEYKHMDDVYVRNIGMTFQADQIIPGDFSASSFRFNSNLYIGTEGSQYKLEVNNFLDVRGDLNVENDTVTKNITVTENGLFNKDIQVENTIASSICRTGDMHILGDLNIDNTRINIQSFHPVMIDPRIAKASNIDGSNLLFFAYDNAINISNSNLTVPGKLSSGATKFDSFGNAQFSVFKTEYANIEMMLKDNSTKINQIPDVEPTMYMGHLTKLQTNDGDIDNSVIFNTNHTTNGLHNMYFYPGNDIVTNSEGFQTPPTFAIHQNGRVGVNNKNPQYELDVVGNILANDIYIRTNSVASKAMFFVSKKDEFSQSGDASRDFFYIYDTYGDIDKYCININDIKNQEGFCGNDISLKGLNVKGGIHATTGGYYQHNKEVANFIIENPHTSNISYINKNIVVGCDRNIQTRAPVAVKSMYDDKYNDSIMRFYKGENRGIIDPRFSGIDMCSSINITNPTLAYEHANSNKWFMYRDHRFDQYNGTNKNSVGMLRIGHTIDSERPNEDKPDPISIVAFENQIYTTHINRTMTDFDIQVLEDMADKAMVIHGDLEVRGNINITGKYSLNGGNVKISPDALDNAANIEETVDNVISVPTPQINDVVLTGNKVAILPQKTLAVGHNAEGFVKYLNKLGNDAIYDVPLTVYQNNVDENRVSKFMSIKKAGIELCVVNLANIGQNVESKDTAVNFEVYKSSELSVFNIKGSDKKINDSISHKDLITIYHSSGINYTRIGSSQIEDSSIIQNVALHVHNDVKHLLFLENTSSLPPAITMKGNGHSFWTIEAPNEMDEFVLKFDKNLSSDGLVQDNGKKVMVVTPNKMGINKDCPLYALDVLGEEDRSCMRITNEYSETSIYNKYSKIEVSNLKLQYVTNEQYIQVNGFINPTELITPMQIYSQGLRYYVDKKEYPIRDVNGKRIIQDFLDIDNLVAVKIHEINHDMSISHQYDEDNTIDINYKYMTQIKAPTTIIDIDNIQVSYETNLTGKTLTIKNIVKFLKPVPDGLYAGDTFRCELEDHLVETFEYQHSIMIDGVEVVSNIIIEDIYQIYKFNQNEEHTFHLEINTIEYQPHIVLQNNILFDTIHQDGTEIKNGKVNKIFSKDGTFEIVTEDEVTKKSILRIDDTGDTFITGDLDVTSGSIKTDTIFMNDIYIKGDIYDKMGNSMTYNYSENMFDRAFIMQSSNYILHTSNYSIHVLSNLDFMLAKECTTGMKITKEYDNNETQYDLFRITEVDKSNNEKSDLAFVISKGGQVGIQREPGCCYDLDVNLSTRSPYIYSHEIVSDTIQADGSNLRNVNLSDRDTSMLKEGSNLYFTPSRVAKILDASNVDTCNYIRKLDGHMSNYVKTLDLDQIAIGDKNTYIVNNNITNTNSSNQLHILGNLFVTGNVTILGSNKVLTTSDQSNTSLCIAGITKEPSFQIHRTNDWNDIMIVTSQYNDDHKDIFNIAKNGGIKVNKPMDNSDDYFKFDVEGPLRATRIYGIGENISNVNFNDKSTDFLKEGTSNLYFTSFRVAEILNASNIDTCNYIRELDSNMSNYIETSSNQISNRITYTSNEIREKMKYTSNEIIHRIVGTSNEIRQEMRYTSNEIREEMKYTSNEIINRIVGTSNEIREKMKYTSNEIIDRIVGTSNEIREEMKYTSNEIIQRIVGTSNEIRQEMTSTSNFLSNKITDINNNLQTVIHETTNTTYAKYTFNTLDDVLIDSSVNKNDLIKFGEGIDNIFDGITNRLKLNNNSVRVPRGSLDNLNILKIDFDFELSTYLYKIFQIEYVFRGKSYKIVLDNNDTITENSVSTLYIPKRYIFQTEINKFEMMLFKNYEYTDTIQKETFDILLYINDKIIRLDFIDFGDVLNYIYTTPNYLTDKIYVKDNNNDDISPIYFTTDVVTENLMMFQETETLLYTVKFSIIFDQEKYPTGVILKGLKIGFSALLGWDNCDITINNIVISNKFGDDDQNTITCSDIENNNIEKSNIYEITLKTNDNLFNEVKIESIALIYESNHFDISFGGGVQETGDTLFIDNIEISVQDTITLRETTMLCRDTFAENINNCGINQINSSTSNLVVNENITSSNINSENINTISLFSDIANISNLTVYENITSSNITLDNINTKSMYSSSIETLYLYADNINVSNLNVKGQTTTINTDSYTTYNFNILESEDGPGITIETSTNDAIVVTKNSVETFRLDNDGKIYNKTQGLEIDVITNTSNYVENTSNEISTRLTNTSNMIDEKFTYSRTLKEVSNINLANNAMTNIFETPFAFKNNCLNCTYIFEIENASAIYSSYNIGIFDFKTNTNRYVLRLEIVLSGSDTMDLYMYNKIDDDKINTAQDGDFLQKTIQGLTNRDVNTFNISIFHNSFAEEESINDFTILFYINDQYIPVDISDFQIIQIPTDNFPNNSLKISIYSDDYLSPDLNIEAPEEYYKRISNLRVREIKQQYPIITESVLINNTSNLNPKPFMLTSNNNEVFSIGTDGRIYVQGSEYKPSEFQKLNSDIYYEQGRFNVCQQTSDTLDTITTAAIDYSIFAENDIVSGANLYYKTDDDNGFMKIHSKDNQSFEISQGYTTIFKVENNQVYIGEEVLSEFGKEVVDEKTNLYYNSGKFGVSSSTGVITFPTIETDYTFYTDGNIYCNGTIMATGDVIAAYSDVRLKTKISNICDPIEKIMQIETFNYISSPLAQSLGITNTKSQIGVSAQSVQQVLPEIIHLAPFDTKILENGDVVSKSGSNFLTVSYERLVPLLIECVKQQQKDIEMLKNKLM